MKALVLTGYGGPEAMALRDVPRPGPKAGEVLVRVHAAALNPVDYKIRQGKTLLSAMPGVLGFEAAAGVPLAGLTALRGLLDELHLKPGSRVFIPGGAGGVGTFAIGISKVPGAHVATTASPRGKGLVERLGAEVVIDYTTQRVEDHVSTWTAPSIFWAAKRWTRPSAS